MERDATARDELDGWLIGSLRQQPRRERREELVERLIAPRESSDLLERLGALEGALLELAERLEVLESERRSPTAATLRPEPSTPEPTPADEQAVGHTFFVPAPHGYALVETAGVPPPRGASVTIDERRYTVEGSRRTPLPLDRRPCIVLARVPAAEDPGTGNP
jgi:hypothetical protein